MRSRSAERGATAVEAAIVIVLISGILSGAIWIFCGYEAKLGATHEARAEVWTTAMSGASCGDGDDSLSPLDRSLARARQVARGTSLTRSLSSSLSITSTTK